MVKFLSVLAAIGAAFVINCIGDVRSQLDSNLPTFPTVCSNFKICNMTNDLSECICETHNVENGLPSTLFKTVNTDFTNVLRDSGTKCLALDVPNYVQQLCLAKQMQIIADILKCISKEIDRYSDMFTAPDFLRYCLDGISNNIDGDNYREFTRCDKIGGNVEFAISVANDVANGVDDFKKHDRILAILFQNGCFVGGRK